MGKKDMTVGLDIGSNKICVLICERGDDDILEVVGVGTGPSAGLRRGVIVDIDSAAAAVSDAVARAENMSGCGVVSVVASVSGAHVSSMNSKGVVAVGRTDREIAQEDVDRVLEAAKVVAIPPDREVVHVLPREFIIDGCRGIRRPIGMTGIRLEVETHIITGSATSIQNVHRVAARAGLEVEQVVLQPLAAAEAVLAGPEKELGVLVVDIGGATTDIAVFLEGSVQHTAVIPVGGGHITNDIALVLRIPVAYAEELKIRYGAARADMVGADELCGPAAQQSGSVASGVPASQISRRQLCEIIEARVAQIMDMVKAEVGRVGLLSQLPAGVVVTGGTAEMRGVIICAQDALQLPARLGVPTGVSGMADVVANPTYSTAVGLVKYAWAQSGLASAAPVKQRRQGGFVSGVRQWFRDIFSS
ncbi:MAG: cell division protein FtsA [Clostridia bacterium]|nr:cell division protein FtsA [Clostridia bacterium]